MPLYFLKQQYMLEQNRRPEMYKMAQPIRVALQTRCQHFRCSITDRGVLCIDRSVTGVFTRIRLLPKEQTDTEYGWYIWRFEMYLVV